MAEDGYRAGDVLEHGPLTMLQSEYHNLGGLSSICTVEMCQVRIHARLLCASGQPASCARPLSCAAAADGMVPGMTGSRSGAARAGLIKSGCLHRGKGAAEGVAEGKGKGQGKKPNLTCSADDIAQMLAQGAPMEQCAWCGWRWPLGTGGYR